MNDASAVIVDHQAHWYPPAYFESVRDRSRYPRSELLGDGYRYASSATSQWPVPRHFIDLDGHLEDMDRHGIDVSVLSANMPGQVDMLDILEAHETLELLNEEIARAQRTYPERFCGLAMLPMQDPDVAVKVLRRAVEELRLRGVLILSNTAGTPIATPATLPIYQEIERLGVPLFLHPSHASVAHAAMPAASIEVGLAWMFDTAAAALSLIFSGTLDACPELTVVHPHLGGVLPYVLGRVEEVAGEIGDALGKPLNEYMRTRFYVDCVSPTPGAAEFAATLYGPERVLYATDFPWAERGRARAFLDQDLAGDEARRILQNRVPGLAMGC